MEEGGADERKGGGGGKKEEEKVSWEGLKTSASEQSGWLCPQGPRCRVETNPPRESHAAISVLTLRRTSRDACPNCRLHSLSAEGEESPSAGKWRMGLLRFHTHQEL